MDGVKKTLHEFLALIPVVEEVLARYECLPEAKDTHKTLSELKRKIQWELNYLDGTDE